MCSFRCYLCIVLCGVGHCNLVANINNAIIHNLKTEYATNTLPSETSGIVRFVREVLNTCHTSDSHVAGPERPINATTPSASIRSCEDATFNSTACRLEVTKQGFSSNQVISTNFFVVLRLHQQYFSNLRDAQYRLIGRLRERESYTEESGIDICHVESCIGANDIIELVNADDLKMHDIFPALLYSITSPNCKHDHDEMHQKSRGHEKTPSWKAWLYGCLFCVILCLISNIGAFMAPFMKTAYFQRFLLFCVGIAVGTMAATGFLVLLPESMGLSEEDSPVPDYTYKLSCSIGAIYFFFVCEKFLKKIFKRRNEKRTPNKELDIQNLEDAMEKAELMKTQSNDGLSKQQNDVNQNDEKNELKAAELEQDQKKKVSIATVAYVLMTGDSLHKFVDGVSVGAAFTENVYVGFSVGLAIVCEELPHELGDIAILLQSGVPMKKALIVNTLTGAVSFIGVVVGILLGENTDANMWIFAIAGGMFIYIALIDMIPAMDTQVAAVVENVPERELPAFLIQNAGLILGYVIMLLVTIYSGNINL